MPTVREVVTAEFRNSRLPHEWTTLHIYAANEVLYAAFNSTSLTTAEQLVGADSMEEVKTL